MCKDVFIPDEHLEYYAKTFKPVVVVGIVGGCFFQQIADGFFDSAEDAVADAEAAAEEAFQTKTVKRVVKKRVVEEPVE